MQPEQDWLPISIPQTYLIVTSSVEEADGVVLLTPFLLCDFPHPWTFYLMLLDIAEARENPDQRGASVSSYRIGNLARRVPKGTSRELQQALSTLCAPLGRGAVSRRRVTVQILEQATSQSLGSPAAHTSILSRRLSLWDYTKLLYEP